jgi:succinoglycan biosynthesis transport protein ExoP
MFTDQKIDYLPKDRFIEGANQEHDKHAQFRQKRKWQILVVVFVSTFILMNLFVWLRAPIYQSQAILQFTSSNNLSTFDNALWQQAIEVTRQRLMSDSVLVGLSQSLRQQHDINRQAPELTDILSITSNLTSNVLILEAKGSEPEILSLIIETWISNYLANLKGESSSQNKDELNVIQQQLSVLQDKINSQRETIQDFAQLNQIISVERDENQILSKMKGLNLSLEAAENQKTEALAKLENLNQSLKQGIVVERPSDTVTINALKAQLAVIQSELKALKNKYTAEYLQRDPAIVAKQQEATDLELKLKNILNESQIANLTDNQGILEVAVSKAKLLRSQISEQQQLAQQFNQKLEQYKGLEAELLELQRQEQVLKSRLVEIELTRPFEANINLLEPASKAQYPIGPDYWRDTLIALALAVIFSLLALGLFSFIVRPKQTSQAAPNIVVVPHYGAKLNDDSTNSRTLIDKSVGSVASLALSDNTESKQTRILQSSEIKTLYQAANQQGKTLIGLILCGVALDEMSKLSLSDFSDNFASLNISGDAQRQLQLPQAFVQHLKACFPSDDRSAPILASRLSEDDLNSLVINAAYDADLILPEQVSLFALRHNYIRYLIEQGVRLNDIELLCGYIAPAELRHFRQFKAKSTIELAEVRTNYPFLDEDV